MTSKQANLIPSGSWAEIVRLRPRFLRSIHLEKDSDADAALVGYIVTPLVHANVTRVVEGLQPNATARAWSITGPYGSGKSAFALFLAKLLSQPAVSQRDTARALLGEYDPKLKNQIATTLLAEESGLIPVLVTGERRALDHQLLEALQRTAQNFWTGRGSRPEVLKQIDSTLHRISKGGQVPAREVVRLFSEVSEKICASVFQGRGLLLIVDEAGKSLEFAASNPSKADIHLLQEMAEAASRSGESPLVFVVLLHQSFERYAGKLGSSQRLEWSKVQGRFEDIPYQEPSDQLLRLIGSSLRVGELPERLRKKAAELAAAVAALANPSVFHDKAQLQQLLMGALPLHPIAALSLGPLFRSRIAQNERSLFAFLSSTEPNAFVEFLQAPVATKEEAISLYSVDRLYDYVRSSFGARLYGQHERHWMLAEELLRRLPEGSSGLDARLLKAICLLGVLGEATGLSASEPLLQVACFEYAPKQVSAALERLKGASLIIYRKYRDAYQLWEGSDLDVDALVVAAKAELSSHEGLIQRLSRVAPPRPMVARRHLFETGTSRYVEVRYLDGAQLRDSFDAFFSYSSQADGLLWLVLAETEGSVDSLRRRLAQPMSWLNAKPNARPIIVALPSRSEHIRELALELISLERVQSSTPQLQDDPVARREISGRLGETERLIREALELLLGGEAACTWHHHERQWTVHSARALARSISEICDQAYDKAPTLHNELINRQELSSAAAAARRNLMEAMALRAQHPRLGLQGTPPEVSMYRSVLEEHGLHALRNGKWSLGAPAPREKGSMSFLFEQLSVLLNGAGDQKVPFTQLYDLLRSPPFGIRDGVLPVVVLAWMLGAESDLALYEEGAYVTALVGPVLERLLRSPVHFELQNVSVSGSRALLLEKLSAALTPKNSLHLLALVRNLIRLVRGLPDYSRQTQSLSTTARAVRESILKSREPGSLIFKELPLACGTPPIELHSPVEELDAFVEGLKGALRELQRAYPSLLQELETQLFEAFGLDAASRLLLIERAQRLVSAAVDLHLKGFVIRLSDAGLSRDEWLISIATLLSGKPPEAWYDRDLTQMLFQLKGLVHKFRSLESLAASTSQRPNNSDTTFLRLCVSEPGAPEAEQVVAFSKSDHEAVLKLQDNLMNKLRVKLFRSTAVHWTDFSCLVA